MPIPVQFLFLHRGIDNRLCRLKRRLYTHFRRIKQVRVLRWFQRTISPAHIPLVTFLHICENRLVIGSPPLATISS